MRIHQLLVTGTGLLASLLVASPAFADIHFFDSNVPGNLDPVGVDGTDTGSDGLVLGLTSGDNWIVNFYNPDENITASTQGPGPSQGQVWVVGVDGGLRTLDISVPGYTFEAAEISLVANHDTGQPAEWNVTLDGYDGGGVFFTQSFTGLTGQEFLNFTTTNNEVISHIAFSTTADVALGHLRLGDVAAVVPEPATWGLMISGFAAVGAMLRRRRSQYAFM